VSKRLGVNSVPAIVGIVGPVVVIAGDLTASSSISGYSLVRDSVSSFALTSLGWLQTICFLAMGFLWEIFAAGLYFNIRRARGFRVGILLFALCGFVLMLIGRLPYGSHWCSAHRRNNSYHIVLQPGAVIPHRHSVPRAEPQGHAQLERHLCLYPYCRCSGFRPDHGGNLRGRDGLVRPI
jgi:hypothetical protein